MPTLTLDRDDRGAPPPLRAQPALVLALACDAPTTPPTRWLLGGIDEIAIGRGDVLSERSGRALKIELADGSVSSRHAAIARDVAGYVLVDLASKNGTRVGGRAIDRVRLADGDVIEIGKRVFVYRAAMLAPPDALAIVDGRAEGVRGTGFATLDPALAAQLTALADVASSPQPIIVTGESGTGKELIARAVHARSGRSGALVAVNCGALPDTMVEAELFGHRKGAFSGAIADRDGLVRAADRGTLFLDEIGDLPLAAQAALLRVLQEREVVPVGGAAPVAVDFRAIAATHRDLPAMVARGEFREDLYARLAGFTLRLPPLRERRQDLGLIAGALIERHARGAAVTIDPAAAHALFAHAWPRNVRELEQCLATAIALARGGTIKLEHLNLDAPAPEPIAEPRLADGDDTLHARLLEVLAEHKGNVSAVARAMGTTRMQVHRWAKRFAIDLKVYR